MIRVEYERDFLVQISSTLATIIVSNKYGSTNIKSELRKAHPYLSQCVYTQPVRDYYDEDVSDDAVLEMCLRVNDLVKLKIGEVDYMQARPTEYAMFYISHAEELQNDEDAKQEYKSIQAYLMSVDMYTGKNIL